MIGFVRDFQNEIPLTINHRREMSTISGNAYPAVLSGNIPNGSNVHLNGYSKMVQLTIWPILLPEGHPSSGPPYVTL